MFRMVCIVDMVIVKCRARRLCPGRGARLVRRFLYAVVMVVVGLKLLLVVGITILSSSPEIFSILQPQAVWAIFYGISIYLSMTSVSLSSSAGA